MWSTEQMERARELLSWGLRTGEVAAEVGVPTTTVARWRSGRTTAFGGPVELVPWRPPHAETYAYLLGIYLGDGHVAVVASGKAWLRVALDGLYPEIIQETVDAIGLASLGRRVQVYADPRSRGMVVQCGWKRWRGLSAARTGAQARAADRA